MSDQIGRERVDLADDAAQEVGFREFVKVDIGELRDAEVVERIWKVGDGDRAGDDADLVAGELAGVERQAGSGERGPAKEVTAGEEGFPLCDRLIGHASGHSP